MKRNVLIVGLMAIVMLSTADLMAQRGGQDRGQRDGRRGNDREVRDRRGGDRDNARRGDRTVRVVDRRRVDYDGYRGSSYYRYGSSRDYSRYQRYRKSYRPSKRHIWIAGQWEYSRRLNRDVWRDGYWVVKQRNHRWVDGHYDRRGGIRIWIPGCWVVF